MEAESRLVSCAVVVAALAPFYIRLFRPCPSRLPDDCLNALILLAS
jgi:hypothetical protein